MPHLIWLDDDAIDFPATHHAFDEPNGLLAGGGNLSPECLINAYRQGIFPWYNEDEEQEILWWTPTPRAVLFPEQIHISRSLKRLLRKKIYRYSFDTCFTDVMRACQAPRSQQDGTWIGSSILDAYTHLHELGYAHSIEVWQDDELVGGLYGIALGKIFFGESMFSRAPSASQCALKTLCDELIKRDFKFLDCQVESPHVMHMGAQLISRESFEEHLKQHINQNKPEKTVFI